jgi:hypothetical protein
MPYTPAQALDLAKRLGAAVGLREEQLPTSVFVEILNGLEECEKVLEGVPREGGSPVPLVQLHPPIPDLQE